MIIPSKLQPVLYSLGAFSVFIALSLILKFITKQIPTDAEYFGILSNKDILIGVFVAIIMTFTHYQKKKIK